MQLHALHDAKIVPNKKFMSIKEKDQEHPADNDMISHIRNQSIF